MADKKVKKKPFKKDKHEASSDKKAKSDEILESLFNDVKNSAEVLSLIYFII